METFTLKVIGFSRVFYEGEASQVQLPIQDGSMGIMAHHEAAVIGIVPGTMRLQTPDGEWQSAVVDAGFARVGENTVSVMVEEVLRPEEIDEERERRALAEALFGDEKALVRLDMSEYMERHTVSRLIGSPPGYVGHEEGGQLTEKVRRKPYSVVLFDEIEKAHEDVWNVLLQILDDGRITDSQGRTVDFKNTVIVMTSNLGSSYILEGIKDGRITEEARAQVNLLLKQSFRPEFLNRIDDIVFYKPLDKEEIFKITDLMLEDIRKRLKERRLDVKLTDRAKNYLAETGYDPQYGARPLKRLLSSKLETLLARKIIEGDPAPDTVFTVDYDGENLTVSESKGE